MKVHQLAIEFRSYPDPMKSDGSQLTYADFIIDGQSLGQRLEKYEMIPSLGWGNREYQKDMIQYYLLQKPHPFLWYRTPILVCSLCGDLECGYISAKLERRGDVILWHDFYKDNYQSKINIGPFFFRWDDYQAAILSTLTEA